MIELNKYRSDLANRGLSSSFSQSKSLLTIYDSNGLLIKEVHLSYNCGSWFVDAKSAV